MSPRGREIATAYYEAGYAAGVAHGRQQLAAEWTSLHAAAADVARQVADRGPFADLAERRGQHARAERQRAILRERGVVA